LVNEREAVTTIMEQKIKVLVQSVAQSVAAVVNRNPQLAGSEPGLALSKDLKALQHLVGASIAALKNAAANSAGPPTTPGASNNPQNGGSLNRAPPRPQGPPSAQSYTPSGPPTGPPGRPLSQSTGDLPKYGSSAPIGGLGTPISLPSFPVNQQRAPLSTPSNNGYEQSAPNSVPNPNRASYSGGSQSNGTFQQQQQQGGGGAQSNGWGAKDEFYNSGDVFRSVERR
jgi:hypothetical protein